MTDQQLEVIVAAVESARIIGMGMFIRSSDDALLLESPRDWTKQTTPIPIPMRLPCPACGAIHLDVDEFATKPHHTHACQECGNVWRPAVVNTVGVKFLPGFRNEDT